MTSIFTGSNEMEEAVKKSTADNEVAPKRKHVRKIVILSWRSNSAMPFYQELAKRPMDQKAVVAYKALHTIHKVLQEGPPKALSDSHFQLPFLNSLRGLYGRGAERVYGPLIVEYANFIVEKVNFHQVHPEFDGSFNLEEFMKKTQNTVPPIDKSIQIITHLSDLQDAVLRMQKLIFTIKTARDLNECRVSSLVPLVVESYALYTMTVWFLKKLIDMIDNMDAFNSLSQRFYSQYMELRQFYFEAANVKYVASIIAVPTLPKDPPIFSPTKKKNPRDAPDAQPEPTNMQPQMPANPWAGQNPFAFGGVDLDSPLGGMQSRPGWVNFNDTPAETTPPAQPARAVPLDDGFDPRQRDKEEFDWRARIKELEDLLEKERAEKELLRRELEALRAENADLKNKLAQVLSAVERERWNAAAQQIDDIQSSIETDLRKFENPNNLGDQSATVESIREAQRGLMAAVEDLDKAARSGDQAALMAAMRRVGNALSRLLDVVKGASRLTDDPAVKAALFDATRAVVGAISALLNAIRNADMNAFAAQMGALRGAMNGLDNAASAVVHSAATTTPDNDMMSREEGLQIEDFAERELLAAARAIEEAARSLEAAKRNKKADLSVDEMAISDAIMDAAMAITGATGNLIKMATISQRERIEKGRASTATAFYKKERTFAEGLISAAKAVAAATVALVEQANLSTQGRIEEESLIAASKGVASSTAQLVAASRVTADPYSPHQANLEGASKAVVRATELLVQAAKRPRPNDMPLSDRIRLQEERLRAALASGNQIRINKEKMELQALILKLQKELEQAQKAMFLLNQKGYEK